MSKEIIKVYATACIQSKDTKKEHGLENTFEISINSTSNMHFTIPVDILKYKIKTLNVYLKQAYITGSKYAFNLEGENFYDRRPFLSLNSYTSIESNNTETKYTYRQLTYECSFWSQFDTLYIENENGDNPPYLEIETITPEIKNFKVEGTSIDGTVICTWEQEDVEKWTLEVIQDNNVILTKEGVEPCYNFNAGSLKHGGLTKFRLTVECDGKKVTEEKEVDLQYTKATIDILEVPNTVNVDEFFKISWVSRNQTNFTLDIDGRKFEGTTQQELMIPGGLIYTGTKTATLTVAYNGPYYSNYDSTNVTFVAYGKPQKPSLKLKSVYNSATPIFEWESSEQTSYKLTIKKLLTEIENSGEVIGNKQYYQTQTVLENNVTYTVTLQVRNKYEMWSDEVSQDFTVQFNTPNTPTITAIADTSTGGIILNISTDTTGDSEYKCSEIWKREIGGTWKRMAFKLNSVDAWNDFYVAGGIEYEYKARNIGKNGGISESDIIKCKTVVLGMNIYNVENQKEFLRFTCGQQPKDKLNQTVVSNMFAGVEAPIHFSDGVIWWSTTLTFTLNTREEKHLLKNLMKRKLLLYKDNKGRKYFGNITNSPDFSEDDVEIIDVVLEFKESIFQEYDLYCGTNMQLIEWNGGWAFDGTHVFGGE